MKRATLVGTVGIVLLLWATPPLDAQRAYRCLLIDPDDPDACEPPPCEFMAGLEYAKAKARARAKFPSPSPWEGASGEARLRYMEAVVAATEKERLAYRKCGARIDPGFSVHPERCEISEPLESAVKSRGTCREFVEASYKNAETRQKLCRATPALRAALAPRRGWIAAEDEVKDLKASLLGYLASCVPDAELSRQLTDAGLDSLKKVGRILRENWLARRATAGAGGGR